MNDRDATIMPFIEEYEDESFDWLAPRLGEGRGYEIFSNVESPFDEGEEVELALELLMTSDEDDLEYFLGKLIKRASKKIRKFMKSGTGRALGGLLKKAAKVALPLAGRAVGTYFGGPLGGTIGAQAGSMAGRIFGLELGELSDDEMFEVSRRFIRLAGTAAKNAALAPSSVPSQTAARTALKTAARVHAPGLFQTGGSTSCTTCRKKSGHWIRRGKTLVLLGV